MRGCGCLRPRGSAVPALPGWTLCRWALGLRGSCCGLARASDGTLYTGGFKGSGCGQPGAGGRPCAACAGSELSGCFARRAEGPLGGPPKGRTPPLGVPGAAGVGDTGGVRGWVAVSPRPFSRLWLISPGTMDVCRRSFPWGPVPGIRTCLSTPLAAAQGKLFHLVSGCPGWGVLP